MAKQIRWVSFAVWTGILCLLQLLPSNIQLVSMPHKLAGGTEIADAIGHFIFFFVATALLFWALLLHFHASRALILGLILIIVLGAALEIAQLFIPDRGVTLIDFAANWGGALLFLVCVRSWRVHRGL